MNINTTAHQVPGSAEITELKRLLTHAHETAKKERDEEIPQIHFGASNAWPYRCGVMGNDVANAIQQVNKLERETKRRENDLRDLLLNVTLGWVCDQINMGDIVECEINKFIRDVAGDALREYARLTWEIIGSHRGDLLVGYGEGGDPVLFSLDTCERVSDDQLESDIRCEILARHEGEPLHDTLAEAQL